jgi:hypothetical protein
MAKGKVIAQIQKDSEAKALIKHAKQKAGLSPNFESLSVIHQDVTILDSDDKRAELKFGLSKSEFDGAVVPFESPKDQNLPRKRMGPHLEQRRNHFRVTPRPVSPGPVTPRDIR